MSYDLRAFTNDTFAEHAESITSADGSFEIEGISPGDVYALTKQQVLIVRILHGRVLPSRRL